MKKKILSAVLATALTALTLTANVTAFAEESLYAVNIKPHTSAQSVGEAVTRNSSPVEGDVATGDIIQKDGKEYIAIVCGDVNGDAKINSTDFIKVRYAYLNLTSLNEASQMAADVNGDGKLNSTDFMMIRKNYLGGFALGKEGGITYGDGLETDIAKRPVIYYTKKTLDYQPEGTDELFGEIQYQPYPYGDSNLPADETAPKTKTLEFEGETYELPYKNDLKWDYYDTALQVYGMPDYSMNAIYRKDTGEIVRIFDLNYDAVDLDNTSEEELRGIAERMLSKHTSFDYESVTYELETIITSYNASDDSKIYTKGYAGFYEDIPKSEGNETYGLVERYEISYTLYINGIKTESRAVIDFEKRGKYSGSFGFAVYDVDFEGVKLDEESLVADFEFLIDDQANKIFKNGEYEMREPLLFKRNGHIYAEVYCAGELQTSTPEWPVTGTYFLLDYGEYK